jgi:hypothetical protein
MIIKKQDIVNWVFKQPDDREVRFDEPGGASECGCVMVQYARDAKIDFFSCGVRTWERKDGTFVSLDRGTYSAFRPSYQKWAFTYGEIKDFLKSKGEVCEV